MLLVVDSAREEDVIRRRVTEIKKPTSVLIVIARGESAAHEAAFKCIVSSLVVTAGIVA